MTRLTELGRSGYSPERDMPVYAVGCLLAIALPAVLLEKGSGERKHRSGAQPPGSWRARPTPVIGSFVLTTLLLLGLCEFGFYASVFALAFFLNLFRSEIQCPSNSAASLLLRIAVLLVLLTEGLFLFKVHRLRTIQGAGPRETSHHGDRLSDQWHAVRPSTESGGTPFSVLWDGAWLTIMGLLVAAFLAIPDISLLSGNLFRGERCHHWEYYALGPALQVRAGRALGSEAYSQYGVAFPLFLAGIDPIVPLRFDNLLRWSVGFGCVYFTGLALLLRVLLRDRLWAAIGTLVAVNLQCFRGVIGPVIWVFPSSSVLRYGLDVWFFLALCLHIRTRNRGWVAVCGAVNGLAILWEMDTGIYLLGVSVLYSIASAVQPRCPLSERVYEKGAERPFCVAAAVSAAPVRESGAAETAAATQKTPSRTSSEKTPGAAHLAFVRSALRHDGARRPGRLVPCQPRADRRSLFVRTVRADPHLHLRHGVFPHVERATEVHALVPGYDRDVSVADRSLVARFEDRNLVGGRRSVQALSRQLWSGDFVAFCTEIASVQSLSCHRTLLHPGDRSAEDGDLPGVSLVGSPLDPSPGYLHLRPLCRVRGVTAQFDRPGVSWHHSNGARGPTGFQQSFPRDEGRNIPATTGPGPMGPGLPRRHVTARGATDGGTSRGDPQLSRADVLPGFRCSPVRPVLSPPGHPDFPGPTRAGSATVREGAIRVCHDGYCGKSGVIRRQARVSSVPLGELRTCRTVRTAADLEETLLHGQHGPRMPFSAGERGPFV